MFTLEELKKILREHANLNEDVEIYLSDNLTKDLSLDSLDLANIENDLIDTFAFLQESDFEITHRVSTVEDLYKLINTYV